MEKSLRPQDSAAEKALALFMDDYFYKKLPDIRKGKMKSTRAVDFDTQIKGIDVIIEKNLKKTYIDEKASLHYSNCMLPTFAFELDSIQIGHDEPVIGWFVNDNLLTEYYMLIWPNIKCYQKDGKWYRKELEELTKNDITVIEAMFISKRAIRDHLSSRGYDRECLLKCAQNIRRTNWNINKKVDENLIDKVNISYSGQLAEKPINLVIRKELLKELAAATYLISSDGVAAI